MDAGNLAEWVGASFTGLGFLGAIAQLRANQGENRAARIREQAGEQDRRTAMARAVAVKADWQPGSDGRPPDGDNDLMPVRVEVLNAGPYPINTAVLELATDDERFPMQIVIGTILPSEHIRDTYEVPRTEVVFGELTGGARLLFSDTFDNHWARSTFDLVPREAPAKIC